MRFVGQEKGYVTIYDFNPLAISKTLLETSEGSPRTRYGSVPTADGGELIASEGTHSGLLLEEPVRSSLPYRKFKTNLRIEAGQFIMLNEDSILLVRVRPSKLKLVYHHLTDDCELSRKTRRSSGSYQYDQSSLRL